MPKEKEICEGFIHGVEVHVIEGKPPNETQRSFWVDIGEDGTLIFREDGDE